MKMIIKKEKEQEKSQSFIFHHHTINAIKYHDPYSHYQYYDKLYKTQIYTIHISA